MPCKVWWRQCKTNSGIIENKLSVWVCTCIHLYEGEGTHWSQRMSMYACVSIRLGTCLSQCMSMYVSICVYVCINVCLCVGTCLSLCVYWCLNCCMCGYLFVSIYIYLGMSQCMYVYSFVCLDRCVCLFQRTSERSPSVFILSFPVNFIAISHVLCTHHQHQARSLESSVS